MNLLQITIDTLKIVFVGDTILWWTNEHKAYDVHLVATISEWIMAIMMVSYLLTYVTELKWIKFQGILFKYTTKT